jgi:hypothetical protein
VSLTRLCEDASYAEVPEVSFTSGYKLPISFMMGLRLEGDIIFDGGLGGEVLANLPPVAK